jgi:5-formyltetrahydrofolate cyclo-ligase
LRAFPVRAPLVVAFYWPMRAEFDPRFVVRAWRDAGARAVLPVVRAEKTPMEFREWWPGAPTRKGHTTCRSRRAPPVLRPDVLLMPPLWLRRGRLPAGLRRRLLRPHAGHHVRRR